MGKLEQQQLPLQQQQVNRTGSSFFCQRCSMDLSRIGREFSFKCVLVLLLSVSVFLSAFFWVLPRHSRHQSGFDAKEAIKLSATVQAYFKLQKPISLLVPQIPRLEYDIYGEIGVPFTKVAILSMHQAGVSNWTNVVFGILSDPMNVSISTVSLSVLRSSLVELFLQQSNLTLTTTFGQPSSFEILQFPGGIKIIPGQSTYIWQIPQILFNFTLYNSIYEIKENFVELKEQLKLGLHLRPYENVYVQVTNNNGSTKDPPVTVEAAVMSDLGSLMPQRLKQLAQIITGSPPAKNLGLDNSVFGKVKEVSLSSYLNRTIHTTPPTPSPEPSVSTLPALSPSDSPAPTPNFHHLPPCDNCDASSPSDGGYPYTPSPQNEPVHSPAPPPILRSYPPRPSPHCGSQIPSSPPRISHSYLTAPDLSPRAAAHPPPVDPPSQVSPGLSPLPVVSYGSNPGQDKRNGKGSVSSPLASPSISPSPLSSASDLSFKGLWWFYFFGLVTFYVLCW